MIDPLFSIAHNQPEISAFRVYPPEYTPPVNEVPDGTIIKDDKIRIGKWGACWNRYYKLKISYFMSDLAKSTLTILNDKISWQKNLISTVRSSKGFYQNFCYFIENHIINIEYIS